MKTTPIYFYILLPLLFTHAAHATNIDLTKPTKNGNITWSESHSTLHGEKAFDNQYDANSRWLATYSADNSCKGWVQYKFDEPTLVQAYLIHRLPATSLNPVTRMPKDFVLQGSNDSTADKTWVTLDEQCNQNDWCAYAQKGFSFENETPYSFYRLYITANNGCTNYTGLSEIELFSDEYVPELEPGFPFWTPAQTNSLGSYTDLEGNTWSAMDVWSTGNITKPSQWKLMSTFSVLDSNYPTSPSWSNPTLRDSAPSL